jgi:hypothetical protein
MGKSKSKQNRGKTPSNNENGGNNVTANTSNSNGGTAAADVGSTGNNNNKNNKKKRKNDNDTKEQQQPLPTNIKKSTNQTSAKNKSDETNITEIVKKTTTNNNTNANTSIQACWNPLETEQQQFLKSISPHTRANFFNDDVVSPEERADLWTQQSDLGETLINKYAWATPHLKFLKVFQHFSPLIEIGCGKNAYWAQWMTKNSASSVANGSGVDGDGATSGSIDIVAYDVSPTSGGQLGLDPSSDPDANSRQSKKQKKRLKQKQKSNGIDVQEGGPAVLVQDKYKNHTLFLCYPDETENENDTDGNENDGNENATQSKSMGWQCLQSFRGDYIIHVGELYGHSTSLDPLQHPWGRSSSHAFQMELQKQFHCLLQMDMGNTGQSNQWLHTNDTLSVWKRTTHICTMVFSGADSDDEAEDANGEKDSNDDEEDEDVICYKHIPVEEQLPRSVAAPCLAHLLPAPVTSVLPITTDVNADSDEAEANDKKNDMPIGNMTNNNDGEEENHSDSDSESDGDNDSVGPRW